MPIGAKTIVQNIPPVIIVNNYAGAIIQDFITEQANAGNRSKIQLLVDFELEAKTDKRINVDIWLSPMNPLSYQFLQAFSRYYDKLEEHIDLNILYRVKRKAVLERKVGNFGENLLPTNEKYGFFNIKEWMLKDNKYGDHFNEETIMANIYKRCYGYGKYCASVDSEGLTDPKESLDQIVRQNCLWDYAKSSGREKSFFKFAKSYSEKCLYAYNDNENSLKTTKIPKEISICSKSLMLGTFYMPSNDLDSCIDSKYSNPSNKFESESKFFEKMEFVTNTVGFYNIIPAMYVDGHLVRGQLEGHAAVSAICDVIKTKPEFCRQIYTILQNEIENSYNLQQPIEYRYRALFMCFIVGVSCT